MLYNKRYYIKKFDRLTILVDMDNVIANFDKRIADMHNEKYGTNFTADNIWTNIPRHGLSQKYNSGRHEFQHQEGFFNTLEPINGFQSTLKRWRDEYGWKIFFCSSPSIRSPTCHSDKSQWLRNYLDDDFARHLILTKDKTVVFGDILIDDRPNVENHGEINPSWTQILFENAYTQDVEMPHRISGWNDLYLEEVILNIMTQKLKN